MRGIDIYDDKPKPIDERLREGRSLKDGLAGRADMHEGEWMESDWNRPPGWRKDQFHRRQHHTTRGNHDGEY